MHACIGRVTLPRSFVQGQRAEMKTRDINGDPIHPDARNKIGAANVAGILTLDGPTSRKPSGLLQAKYPDSQSAQTFSSGGRL